MFMRPAMEADLQAIKKIYMEAFPLVERAPFSRIIKQWRSGELDILTFREEDNSLIGFSINASEADLVLIDYLAISPAVRGGGYGSKALELMHLYYLGKRIFLIIEHPDMEADNAEQRSKRKRFYLRNGYADSGLRINGVEGRMELLVYVGNQAAAGHADSSIVTGKEFIRMQRKSPGGLLMWLGHIHVEKPRRNK